MVRPIACVFRRLWWCSITTASGFGFVLYFSVAVAEDFPVKNLVPVWRDSRYYNLAVAFALSIGALRMQPPLGHEHVYAARLSSGWHGHNGHDW